MHAIFKLNYKKKLARYASRMSSWMAKESNELVTRVIIRISRSVVRLLPISPPGWPLNCSTRDKTALPARWDFLNSLDWYWCREHFDFVRFPFWSLSPCCPKNPKQLHTTILHPWTPSAMHEETSSVKLFKLRALILFLRFNISRRNILFWFDSLRQNSRNIKCNSFSVSLME